MKVSFLLTLQEILNPAVIKSQHRWRGDHWERASGNLRAIMTCTAYMISKHLSGLEAAR